MQGQEEGLRDITVTRSESKEDLPRHGRRKRSGPYKSPLAIPQILAWADAHHTRTGTWPRVDSGPVPEVPDLTWANIHWALVSGYRGLPGGDTLLRVLARNRRIKHILAQPRLTLGKILRWADAHHERTGRWPVIMSGQVYGAPDERWERINAALCAGCRGLPGGSSLSRFLKQQRCYRRNLTIEQILAWADAHQQRTGRRPTVGSGIVVGGNGETWVGINGFLRRGHRGLPGGSSLSKLLNEHRGPRIRRARRPRRAASPLSAIPSLSGRPNLTSSNR